MGGKKKTDKEKIVCTLIGTNGNTVTGSCLKIECGINEKTYLIDCGINQEKGIEDNYNANLSILNGVDAKEVSAVWLSHGHGDHSLLLPALYARGFRGDIICSYETSQLLPPMFRDGAFIMERECEGLSKKKGVVVKPLYNESDAGNTVDLLKSYSIGELHNLDEFVSFKFLKNPHIVGSVQIEIYFKTKSNKVKKILYTGDLGNLVHPKPFVDKMEYCKTANVVYMESTYGLKEKTTVKQDRKDDIKLIKDMVEDIVINNKSRLLIPVFSLDRCQHMLCVLYDLFKNDERMEDIDIVVDSKLSMDITKVYKDILKGDKLELINTITRWKNVKFVKDYKESKACATDKEPKIILSASGFMQGGHSLIYATEFLSNPNDGILFCGYSSPSSNAGRIRDTETKKIKIDSKVYKKSCKINSLKTFSSHINHADLIKYMKMINCQEIVLIHGDKEAKKELKESADEELAKIGKTTKVTISQRNTKIVL